MNGEMRRLWIAIGLVAVVLMGAIANSAGQEEISKSAIGKVAAAPPESLKLKFLGEISNNTPGMNYLGPEGKVYANFEKGWLRVKPVVRVFDSSTGKELRSRDFKDAPCESGFSSVLLAFIPGSTDLPAEACHRIYILDGETLETKRGLTPKPPKGEKLWSSEFLLSPDGKLAALITTFETKNATRSVISILRATDWQEEGGWELKGNVGGFTGDGKRLLIKMEEGWEVRKMPQGEIEPNVHPDIGSSRSIAADALNPDGNLVINEETGSVWALHFPGGGIERVAQLENWPGSDFWAISVSSDGRLLCAPIAKGLKDGAPLVAIWSTRSGKILAKDEPIHISPGEWRNALSGFMGPHARCQVSGDGKYILAEAGFSERSSRARVYRVVQGE